MTQENVLMATLTVREAIYYSSQIQLPDTMPLAKKLALADETIQEMGLTSALDTRIGGRETKGISGGQRKRLSICLEILTRPRLLFLDEPTSGLDSAASFHVMNRIADLAVREGMTIVAVVHQPCSEVFELFHGLCLLASGQTVYFGPAADAAEVVNYCHLSLLSNNETNIYSLISLLTIFIYKYIIFAVLHIEWLPLPTNEKPLRPFLNDNQQRF